MTYDGELNISRGDLATDFIDILDPAIMVLESIGRNPDHFDPAFGEIRGATSYFSKLGSTDGSKVSRVREQNSLVKGHFFRL